VLLAALGTLAVAAPSGTPGRAPGRSTTPVVTTPTQVIAQVVATPPDPIRAAVAAADALARTGRGTTQVGVAVLDRATGRLDLGELGATAFYSASVVKLFTAVDVLRRAETGGATLTQAHRTTIQRALTVSDDAAMSALWQQFGGPRTVSELAAWAHLRDTRPPARPGEWGETKVSPRDAVAVYAYLLTALTPADQRFVLNALASSLSRGADGFDQSFGLLAVPRLPGVAAKQGWMIDGRSEYLHSTGVLGAADRYVVAVLTKRPASDGWPAGRADVTTAAGRLIAALGLAD
jgi:hypothetical protein